MGRMQDYTKFPVFVPMSLMHRIDSRPDDYGIAIEVVTFLRKLGLRMATEQTIRSITAFVLCVSKMDHSNDTPELLHEMMLSMKKLVRTLLADAEWPWTNPPYVMVLPGVLSDLDPLWKHEAMGTEMPQAIPRVSMDIMAATCSKIPLRKSHRDMRKEVKTGSSSDTTGGIQMVGTMFKEVLALVAQRNDGTTKAKITMLTSPAKTTKPTTLALQLPGFEASTQALSVKEEIESPPRKRNLALAFDAVADPEDMEGKTTRQLADTGVAVSSQHLDAVPGGELIEEAKGLHQDLHGKTLPETSRRGRPTKRPAQKEAGTPMKRPAASHDVTPKKRPASQAPSQTPSTKAKPSSPKDRVEKVVPSKETPSKRPASKQPASKQVAKKPASSLVSLASSGKIKDLLDDAGRIVWTAKARLKAYPNGCGKCREQPGCTPSCYRVRKEL